MTKFTNFDGGILDTANLGADWVSCFNTPIMLGSATFNKTLPSPQSIKITGSAGSTGNPDIDGVRKVVGAVPGGSVVFNS
jgi:hypothetical protein